METAGSSAPLEGWNRAALGASEILTRDARDAWIQLYCFALDAARRCVATGDQAYEVAADVFLKMYRMRRRVQERDARGRYCIGDLRAYVATAVACSARASQARGPAGDDPRARAMAMATSYESIESTEFWLDALQEIRTWRQASEARARLLVELLHRDTANLSALASSANISARSARHDLTCLLSRLPPAREVHWRSRDDDSRLAQVRGILAGLSLEHWRAIQGL